MGAVFLSMSLIRGMGVCQEEGERERVRKSSEFGSGVWFRLWTSWLAMGIAFLGRVNFTILAIIPWIRKQHRTALHLFNITSKVLNKDWSFEKPGAMHA